MTAATCPNSGFYAGRANGVQTGYRGLQEGKLGEIELMHGDCMEYMKNMKDKEYNLAICDPPYGIGEDGRKTKGREGFVKQKNGNKIFVPAKPYKPAGWDVVIPSQEYFNELFRVSKHQIIWGENYFAFHQKELSSGRIVWDKVNGDNDFSDCEIAWISCIKSVRQLEFMWAGFCQGLSLNDGRVQQGNKLLNEKRIHPTQKPVKLYEWLLVNYAKQGDCILDTHLGSGSSAIACHNLGFDFVGIELDVDYFNAAVQRLETHKKQLILFGWDNHHEEA